MESSVCPAGRLYAMQTGMKLDSKTPECRKFLVKLMDQLESVSGSGAEAVFCSTTTLCLTFRWFTLRQNAGLLACFVASSHFCPSGTVFICVMQTLCVCVM